MANLAVLMDGSQLSTENIENLSYFQTKVFNQLNSNTKRAYVSDMKCYLKFCASTSRAAFVNDLQVQSRTIEAYFESLMLRDLGHFTIKRRLSSTSYFAEILGTANPRKQNKLLNTYIAESLKSKPQHQKQAGAFTIELLNLYNELAPVKTIKHLRDKAIVNLAFDGLLRGSEFVKIEVSHFNTRQNTLFLPRRKTDQDGKGGYVFVSNQTAEIIETYKEMSKIKSGRLFKPTSPKGTSINGDILNYQSVLRAFKKAGELIGVDLSSHSGRVGKTVSMAERGAHDNELMLAGGWCSSVMPARYAKQARVAMGTGANLR